MDIITLSQHEYNWLRSKKNFPNEYWVSIRIASNEAEMMRMSESHNKQFEDILNVFFTDIKEDIEVVGGTYHKYSIENHKQIREFFHKHINADKLFIHCNSGRCRSTSVGHGLKLLYPNVNLQHGIDGKSSVYPYPNIVSFFTKDL